MKIFSKIIKSIFLIIVCFCFFIQSNAQNWDIHLLDNINPNQPNSSIWKGASSSVYPIAIASPIYLLTVGYLHNNKNLQQNGWSVLKTLAINTIITKGLKHTLNRARPYQQYPLQIHPYQIETDASFPSGHTSTAFAIATSLSIEHKKWYIVVPAYTWAISVGYSRLYLGVHYPTDVVAGAVVGLGSAYLNKWLNKKLFSKKISNAIPN